jgi:hypothetical protein
MAVSLRRRYPGRLEGRNDEPPTASMPQTAAAQLPPATEATKPAAPLEIETSPVEQAARDAVKKRIAELTETEPIKPVVIEQPNPTEQIIANTGLPPRVQAWLRAHPDYITDKDKNARMQEMHYVAKHHTGEEFTEAYIKKMDELLGHATPTLSIPTLGNPNAAPARPPVGAEGRQQHSGPPVSAPISRDAPSMSTGRPASRRVPLTRDEMDIVQVSGITPEEYQRQKEKFRQLVQAGVISDYGGR